VNMVNELGDPLLRSDKFSSYYPIAPSRLVFSSVTLILKKGLHGIRSLQDITLNQPLNLC
jgi:hypothetical protein